MDTIGIYEPSTLSDLIEILLFLNKYKFYWSGNKDIDPLIYSNLKDSKYIVISNINNNKEIHRISDESDDETIIEIILEYFDYFKYKDLNFLKDLYETKFFILNNRKQIDYNTPKKLVYENKILKFNKYKNV